MRHVKSQLYIVRINLSQSVIPATSDTVAKLAAFPFGHARSPRALQLLPRGRAPGALRVKIESTCSPRARVALQVQHYCVFSVKFISTECSRPRSRPLSFAGLVLARCQLPLALFATIVLDEPVDGGFNVILRNRAHQTHMWLRCLARQGRPRMPDFWLRWCRIQPLDP